MGCRGGGHRTHLAGVSPRIYSTQHVITDNEKEHCPLCRGQCDTSNHRGHFPQWAPSLGRDSGVRKVQLLGKVHQQPSLVISENTCPPHPPTNWQPSLPLTPLSMSPQPVTQHDVPEGKVSTPRVGIWAGHGWKHSQGNVCPTLGQEIVGVHNDLVHRQLLVLIV